MSDRRMTEDEQLTVAQLSSLIEWTEDLRDQGLSLQQVIDRMDEWRAEAAGNMEGPIKFFPIGTWEKRPEFPINECPDCLHLRSSHEWPSETCVIQGCECRRKP